MQMNLYKVYKTVAMVNNISLQKKCRAVLIFCVILMLLGELNPKMINFVIERHVF